MAYRITIKDENDRPQTYIAIGDRDALMDAAYDDGALSVSIIKEPA
ncbi:hypothetical protein [Massilia sp. DD77]